MRKPIIISLLTASALFFSQTQIKVLDAENQKAIPYAKLILKDKDYYINAEENGTANVEQEEKISEIQSYGYENLKVDKNQNIYFLKPKYLEIDEVQIIKPKLSRPLQWENWLKKALSSVLIPSGWSVKNSETTFLLNPYLLNP